MITLTNGIKKVESVDNAVIANFNRNDDIIDAHIGSTRKTVADITYYVRTDGSDTNNGLVNTAGGAFKTIGKAINSLPQTVNHTVTINVAAGTYAEDVSISGFSGKGSINLIGSANLANAGNYIVKSVMIEKNSLQVFLRGVESNNANSSGGSFVIARNPGFSEITFCKSVYNDTTKLGVVVVGSICHVNTCTFSLKSAAISANFMATVCSNNNDGASNLFGLQAANASKIGKVSTQPSATTNESASGGSSIS